MLKHPRPHSPQKIILTVVLLLGVVTGIFLLINRQSETDVANEQTISTNTSTDTSTNSADAEADRESSKDLPARLQLKVPFTPQAPTANWDELHNEACEEASLIMAHAYFTGISSLPAASVEHEISQLTDWQKKTFGYYLSISTPEAVRMAEENYDLTAEMTTISEQTIKQALADGKLVVWAGNGQMLDNPYFTAPGPIYHMLIITGYDGDTFITNDPGTRRGENYKYSYDTLYNGAGNWSSSTHAVDLSDKQIIILSQ